MSGGTWPQLASATRAEKKYWGVSASPADTEAFIESLPGSARSTSCGTVFTVNSTAGTRIYFACPSHFGPVIFRSGGFEGGFVLRSAISSVTDTLGISRSYDLYESVSTGLGVVTITVSES